MPSLHNPKSWSHIRNPKSSSLVFNGNKVREREFSTLHILEPGLVENSLFSGKHLEENTQKCFEISVGNFGSCSGLSGWSWQLHFRSCLLENSFVIILQNDKDPLDMDFVHQKVTFWRVEPVTSSTECPRAGQADAMILLVLHELLMLPTYTRDCQKIPQIMFWDHDPVMPHLRSLRWPERDLGNRVSDTTPNAHDPPTQYPTRFQRRQFLGR